MKQKTLFPIFKSVQQLTPIELVKVYDHNPAIQNWTLKIKEADHEFNFIKKNKSYVEKYHNFQNMFQVCKIETGISMGMFSFENEVYLYCVNSITFLGKPKIYFMKVNSKKFLNDSSYTIESLHLLFKTSVYCTCVKCFKPSVYRKWSKVLSNFNKFIKSDQAKSVFIKYRF